MRSPFGFINAFKPVGISSAAFGNSVKRWIKASAVGHWGTLDPGACGVLVLALGEATRLLPLMPHSRKQYAFELIVGAKTDSGDRDGRILESAPVPGDWQTRLPRALHVLAGVIKQTPPMHSAVKVAGRPLYRSARAGLEISRPARDIRIHDLRLLPTADRLRLLPTAARGKACAESVARLFVECDAGTYVRVLCERIGQELALPAHMGCLLRVAAGDFCLRDSVLPDRLREGRFEDALIDPLQALRQPRHEVDASMALRFVHGNEIVARGARISQNETLVTHNGRLLGSGHIVLRDGRTLLAPSRVLAHPAELLERASAPPSAND